MAKLRSSNIEPSTGTTLALGASGDAALISSDSIKANTWQDLGGNSLWVSDGAGTLSSVNSSLAGGGFTLISTLTVTGSPSTVEITTGIDSTYDEYQVVITNYTHTNENEIRLAFYTTDWTPTVTTTWFESRHNEADTVSELNYSTAYDLAQQAMPQSITRNIGTGGDRSATGIITIYTPSSTTYTKHWNTKMHYEDTSAASNTTFVQGYVNSSSAITGLRLDAGGATCSGGILQLYGVG